MNNYERIQKAINYIEENLDREIDIAEVAVRACFSVPHFYRIFHSLTGHTVKEYIRSRRLSEAARRLKPEGARIIDLSFDYLFGSQEAFTRAFKEYFGITPGAYKEAGAKLALLPALNLAEKYFDTGANELFPDPRIKVLKHLEPMRVASYRAVSASPELEAWDKLLEWAGSHDLLGPDRPYRMFGFDNPTPSKEKAVYGYEVWITVEDDISGSDDITVKTFPGGLYAVTGTTIGDIKDAWNHFNTWLKISKYKSGKHQCLEEHLAPLQKPDQATPLDLYLPLSDK